MKKMGDSRIRIRNLWLPFRGEIPRISNIQDTNASADTKSARHGQNQEKKRNSDYWITELNIFLSKFFRRKLGNVVPVR